MRDTFNFVANFLKLFSINSTSKTSISIYLKELKESKYHSFFFFFFHKANFRRLKSTRLLHVRELKYSSSFEQYFWITESRAAV